jgi:hypothetical protein
MTDDRCSPWATCTEPIVIGLREREPHVELVAFSEDGALCAAFDFPPRASGGFCNPEIPTTPFGFVALVGNETSSSMFGFVSSRVRKVRARIDGGQPFTALTVQLKGALLERFGGTRPFGMFAAPSLGCHQAHEFTLRAVGRRGRTLEVLDPDFGNPPICP